jgi:hypothetical protein
MEAANVQSIPRSFLIRKGRVALIAHPRLITEELIDGLLAGNEAAEKQLQDVRSMAEKEALDSFVRGGAWHIFDRARKAGDVAEVERVVNKLAGLDERNRDLLDMKLELILLKNQWSKLIELAGGSLEDPLCLKVVRSLTDRIARSDQPTNYPAEVAASLVKP